MNYRDKEIATSYKYKIKWLFGVAPDLFDNYKKEIKNLLAVVRALGANSFDRIAFKDSEGKVLVAISDGLIMGDQKKINDRMIRNIKRKLKNTNIYYVELIRT
jgi:hypothetical protein